MDTAGQEPQKKRKKRSDVSGWCKSTTDDRIKKMKQHPVLGDWRRFGTVKIKSTIASVKWTESTTGNIATFHTPIPVGMKDVLQKMESQQNRNFKQLPLVVKEQKNRTSHKTLMFLCPLNIVIQITPAFRMLIVVSAAIRQP